MMQTAWLVLLAMPACVGDLGIDDVPWACERDSQCGWRARCVDSVCVLVDGTDTNDTGTSQATDTESDTTLAPDGEDALDGAETQPSVTGMTCEATLLATVPHQVASFRVYARELDGRLMVHVTLGDLDADYPLPDGVVPIEGSTEPLTTCCEDPCCPEL